MNDPFFQSLPVGKVNDRSFFCGNLRLVKYFYLTLNISPIRTFQRHSIIILFGCNLGQTSFPTFSGKNPPKLHKKSHSNGELEIRQRRIFSRKMRTIVSFINPFNRIFYKIEKAPERWKRRRWEGEKAFMMPLFRSGSRDLRHLVYSLFIYLKLSLKNSLFFDIDLSAPDLSVFGCIE